MSEVKTENKMTNVQGDELEQMFNKIVVEQQNKLDNGCTLDSMMDDFWKSIENGSMFEDKELMKLADEIVKKNPGIMDNF